MSKLLDCIVIIDVESTCWEDAPPPGQENEIIEIGVCLLDPAAGKIADLKSILVKPERSEVSEFCTRLTTLTGDQVAAGCSFREACSLLKKTYKAKERAWASYGDYDRRQFERQCRSREIGFPFGPTHLNVKNLFALIQGLEREEGMGQALERLGMPLEGTHHRGVDDANNIARILCALLARAQKGSTDI